MSNADTPDLSKLLEDQAQLDAIGARILGGGPRAIRYRERGGGGKSMVFVAHRQDVIRVLTDEDTFSLCHYDRLYAAIAPRGAFIIMRPEGAKRDQRLAILSAAKARTPWFGPDPTERRALARACVDNIVAAIKARGEHRFDIISEYAFFAPYLIAKRVIGLTGRRSFSLLAVFVCWLNGHSIFKLWARETGPYLTELTWSEFVVAQLIKNFENRSWLFRALGRCSAWRLRAATERYVDTFPRTSGDRTLLNALWAVRAQFPEVEDKAYREHVVSVVMELLSTILLVPGGAFSSIIERWLQPDGPGLEASLRLLQAMDAEDFTQEELRLAPPSAFLLRNATGPAQLGGLTVETGEYVCALVKTAGLDIGPKPDDVRSGRPPDTYLHFGPVGGPHLCLGHLLAPAILAEMFLGLTRLPRLAARGGKTQFDGSVPGRLMMSIEEPIGTAL